MTPFVRPPMHEVVARLDLRPKGRRCVCPSCKSADKDGRLPCVTNPKTWHCVACGASGGTLEMVAYALGLEPPVKAQTFITVRNWVLRQEVHSTPVMPPSPPQRIDPTPALSRAKPLSSVSRRELVDWLQCRAILPTSPAGWLPDFRAPWWPGSRQFPVVIPACTGLGEIRSMHGVAISASAPRKTTWPKGAESRELLFADRFMRSVLRGQAPWPDTVLFVEGATDFLTASPQMPTIGVFAGAAGALRLVRLPRHVRVYIGTDPDEAGDRYATEICDILTPHPVRRLPLHRLV